MVSFTLRAIGACLIGLPALITAAPTSHISSDFHVVEQLNAAPQGWVQGGSPAPSTLMKFKLALVQSKTAEFEQRVMDISNPRHADYGKHMSREEVDAFLQPSSLAKESVLNWLSSEGVSKHSVKANTDWLTFTTTIENAEKLFDTHFYTFKNTADGSQIIRTLKYSVPASAAPYIQMIQPTTKFNAPRPELSSVFTSDLEMTSSADVDCNVTVTPDCIRDLYKMGNTFAKKDPRNRLGISGYLEQYARLEDFSTFIDMFVPSLKGTTFDFKSINGGKNEQNSTLDSVEASLDVDYAIGLSGALSTYYGTAGRGKLIPDLDQPNITDNNNEPYIEQLFYLLDLPDSELPAVLSTSYGENEQSIPASYTSVVCSLFGRLGARGVSVIFSSGDTGVGSACQSNDGKNTTKFNPIFPAACPFVTSVGGTHQIKPEVAIHFSSGGFSERFARPWYQELDVRHYLGHELEKGKWDGLYNPSGRGFPDVAAQSYKFATRDHGKTIGVSGTSASAPLFAAVVSILNSIRLAHNKPKMGFLNPWLYTVGRSGFTDIVHGGSTGCTGTDIYSHLPTPYVPGASWNATKGWDPVTGLGTPDFEKLSKLVLAF
ncbi:aorsin [Nannizzia gypsea CBS 118893]|uniref:tripeptidyl-peptidase II n=1 Tax=Arthroderma gypseum (strain ATCC MYA-4604 / CBS 118893) TaxID=535722 RepID=E4UZH2_ARTGP|nr:aorsin [Nannizzia gypsea CBS 118893]EFR03502.1 aorsin [Nannizzia gypsea CBS 118893]